MKFIIANFGWFCLILFFVLFAVVAWCAKANNREYRQQRLNAAVLRERARNPAVDDATYV